MIRRQVQVHPFLRRTLLDRATPSDRHARWPRDRAARFDAQRGQWQLEASGFLADRRAAKPTVHVGRWCGVVVDLRAWTRAVPLPERPAAADIDARRVPARLVAT